MFEIFYCYVPLNILICIQTRVAIRPPLMKIYWQLYLSLQLFELFGYSIRMLSIWLAKIEKLRERLVEKDNLIQAGRT